ncbi:MAG: hypothetical protein PF487_02780 [Bacteroidales bacterium]|jgi:hypothetical protein|nr:hypothetical protein [Bacteroidales bacterium]
MSRLLEGEIEYKGQDIPIEEYRDMISSRSLYSIDNEYENTNKFSLNNKGNVASSISTVLNVIPQYNRMQVNTNLLGNTYDAFRDDGSALAKIGLVMLGKQMAYNSAMNLSAKYIPTIDLSQALKGNPENIFKLNKDNTITVKNPDNNTFLDKVGNVASNVLGIDTYDVIGNDNPFSKNPTKIEYLKNTGDIQLSRFLGAVNFNIYKPLNNITDSQYTQVLTQKMNDVGPKLQSNSKTLFSNNNSGQYRPIFNFDDNKANPYFSRQLSFNSSIANVVASENIILSYSITGDTIQEYAPTYQYIKDNFGDTVKKYPENDINNVVKQQSSSSDNLKEQIVWGRDGVADEAKSIIKDLRGRFDDEDEKPDSNIFNTTNIKKGILEYTRNLLNASEGNFVDITRKAFKDGENYVGFNGSPLWTPNDSKYSIASRNYNPSDGDSRFGVRQHTILDPYDKAAKTIRFEGNMVYNEMGGNTDSVIYKNILPRIHPTDDSNKNLMFSLENLAIGTVKMDKYGIIDDGTPIPLSEVGQFGGRLMWFPPYNVQINEVASAKYESTVMVGRNEPMYNYMNSERSAVLSFSLLVDYPEQLKLLESKKDNNREIANFFAFGGDPLPREYDIDQIEKKIEELKKQLKKTNIKEQAEIATKHKQRVSIYFPNDMPSGGTETTVIDTMYNDMHYEIIDTCLSAQDGNGFGLNNYIYYVQGLVELPNSTDANDKYQLSDDVDQYNTTEENIKGQHNSNNNLTQYLKEFYENENTRKYYDITISGYASKLYFEDDGGTHNKGVAQRRIDAAKHLIEVRLSTLFDESIAKKIINNNIKIYNFGDSRADESSADPNLIHEEEVKKDRRVLIEFERNGLENDNKKQNLTEQQKLKIKKIQSNITNLEEKLKKAKSHNEHNIFNERKEVTLDKFESISKNKYYSVFHSQTPEDFHRRLTFLQQCTRQGAAKQYDAVDENGILRAKNSVFGKQPISILRVGDFFNTKVIIESVTIDYNDSTWDLNPEGFGLQPMIANITLQMKLIGGQSLKAPIDALQNAISFNYYANSTFTDKGVYGKATKTANKNYQYLKGVDDNDSKNGIVGENQDKLIAAYDAINDEKGNE